MTGILLIPDISARNGVRTAFQISEVFCTQKNISAHLGLVIEYPFFLNFNPALNPVFR